MILRQRAFLLPVLFLLAAAIGCKAGEPERPGTQRLRVVTTLFPLYDFTRAIAGSHAEVALLLPPGVEPHSFEPDPAAMRRIQEADLFIYTNPGMEPWAKKVLASMQIPAERIVEAGGEGAAQDRDPHVWLDFEEAGRIADAVAAALARIDPAHRSEYARNAAAYREMLHGLDSRYVSELSGCKSRVLVSGGHAAFGRLAKRYGLEYVAALGISPDSEPTAADLVRLVRLMKSRGVKTVYSEELLQPRVAQTLARETGGRVLPLHAGHNISQEELQRNATFVSLMERNLASLTEGLECR